ncbi:MAG: hypothetical protein ISS23_03245 [Nanoarchaeota archaeon]|nr:hypothetical protein [Nanoarchaeota archaeon]
MEEFEKQLSKLPKDKIESGMILSIVKKENISGKQQLLSYLQNQELMCREWLSKNKSSSTMNSIRRDFVRKLEEIKVMQEMVGKL